MIDHQRYPPRAVFHLLDAEGYPYCLAEEQDAEASNVCPVCLEVLDGLELMDA